MNKRIECDGVDCKRDAAKLGYLGKSGADVRLCEVCFTRFAVRGLLRLKGKMFPVPDVQDIEGWTMLMVNDFVKTPRN